MSILDNIKDKAKDLLKLSEPYATRATTGYDASKNSIVVAGFPLDGVVSSTISSDSVMRQETGIDYYYTVMYEEIVSRTLTVNVLPTAECLSVMRLLALRQLETKGWFNIAVNENDTIVNVYRGAILSLPEIGMSQEAEDRTITFAIKPMHSGVSVIDQSTTTEQEIYSKSGARPDLGNANDNSTINENTGIITTPLGEATVESLEDVPVNELPNE